MQLSRGIHGRLVSERYARARKIHFYDFNCTHNLVNVDGTKVRQHEWLRLFVCTNRNTNQERKIGFAEFVPVITRTINIKARGRYMISSLSLELKRLLRIEITLSVVLLL